METPSSTTRVTRSQTLAASANNRKLLSSRKVEESEKPMTKSRKKKSGQKQDGAAALIDITNDSPIVGLAMGNLKSPSSAAMSKKKKRGQVVVPRTPGSGEALLRGQVKTLLQKVEEEAEFSKITTLEIKPFFNSSPIINLVAPTPANTPQILSDHTDASLLPPSLPQMMMISEMLDEKNEEKIDQNMMITRSLLLDFSEKSCDSSSSSSVLTYQGAFCSSRGKFNDDDDDASSSVWSIQVNASSTTRNDQEEEEEEEDNDLGLLDEVCEGISNISVKEEVKFMGKHIRFVYNSDDDDDEIEGEEKFMGKHIR